MIIIIFCLFLAFATSSLIGVVAAAAISPFCQQECRYSLLAPPSSPTARGDQGVVLEYDLLPLCDPLGLGYISQFTSTLSSSGTATSIRPTAINICGTLARQCPVLGGVFCMATSSANNGVCVLDPDQSSVGASVISRNFSESCTGASAPCPKCVVHALDGSGLLSPNPARNTINFIDIAVPQAGIKISIPGVPLTRMEKRFDVDSCSGDSASGRFVTIHVLCDCLQQDPLAILEKIITDSRYDCNMTAVFRSSLGCWKGFCTSSTGGAGGSNSQVPGLGQNGGEEMNNPSPGLSFWKVIIIVIFLYLVLAGSLNYYREGSFSIPKSHLALFSRIYHGIRDAISGACRWCLSSRSGSQTSQLHQTQHAGATPYSGASTLSTTDEL
jgi:hypothetical protein